MHNGFWSKHKMTRFKAPMLLIHVSRRRERCYASGHVTRGVPSPVYLFNLEHPPPAAGGGSTTSAAEAATRAT